METVETQQSQVAAERGLSDEKLSDEERADMREVERQTLQYPSPYGAPNR